MSKQPFNVSERQGHHILSIVVNKTRSCACKLKYLLLWLVNLEFFFYFSKKLGRSGYGKRNILLRWPCQKRKKLVGCVSKFDVIFIFLGYITNQCNVQLPVGLIAHLVSALHFRLSTLLLLLLSFVHHKERNTSFKEYNLIHPFIILIEVVKYHTFLHFSFSFNIKITNLYGNLKHCR